MQARSQSNGSHEVNSFLHILRMYREGNKSKNEAYQEVARVLSGTLCELHFLSSLV